MLTRENLAKALIDAARINYWRDKVFPVMQHNAIGYPGPYYLGKHFEGSVTLLKQWSWDTRINDSWRDFERWLQEAIDLFGRDLAFHIKDGVLTVAR